MPSLPIDQFSFWILIVPGFLWTWSFRYFTDSEKPANFEFLGISFFLGVINLLLYGSLKKWTGGEDFPLTNTQELVVAGFGLSIIALLFGLLFAQISKWGFVRKIINSLKSNWFSKK
jgi:hypothetical protein